MIFFLKRYYAHMIGIAVGIGLCIYGVRDFLHNVNGGPSSTSLMGAYGVALPAVMMLAGIGAIAGTILGHTIGDLAGKKFADVFLFPRKFLDRPPVSTSHAEGLIKLHEYRAAEKELLDIIQQHPDHQRTIFLLGQLYLDTFRNYDLAEKISLSYLRDRDKARPGDAEIVNVFMDALLAMNRGEEVVAFLREELLRGGYTRPERENLHTRLENLS